ncbi:MAG: DUF2059 domain-containing protein [Sulfitobacter sp.]
MRALLAACLMLLTTLPLWADARTTVLMDALKLRELVGILYDEGQEYAADLNTDMLEGRGGAGWQVQVEAIYDPDRLAETLRRALDGALSPAQTEASIEFFASDLGQKIIDLENAARRQLADPAAEDAARAKALELEGTGDARLAQINQMIEVSDLTQRNVTSAMNSNFHFLRGLAAGGQMQMSEDEMLADVMAEQDAVTDDTANWLAGFFLLAYSPLSDAELQAYIDFTATEAGQAMNRGFFEGFDAAYNEISFALGRTIALNIASEEL